MKASITVVLLVLSCHAFSQKNDTLTFTLYLNQTVQQIRNIGASGCWFTEEIGTKWPDADRRHIAELLFSKAVDNNGQPKGIGLSAFRYNIGAGTAEQGDSSGIALPAHRVECFLSPDGNYNWNKQQGYTWMLQQAKNYGVQDLIAFVNSPPVQFTKTGLGYKLTKDSSTNLREDKYKAYATFLATVLRHFDQQKLHFNYVSPVNEPQWDWSGVKGQAKQEGSPYTNREIFKVASALNDALAKEKLSTKILLTEAAMLDHLIGFSPKSTSRQLESFWNPASPLYVGSLTHSTKFVEGHGYFTDNGAQLINTREHLRDSLKKYDGLEYWQSEYCMLANGYRDGTSGRLEPIDYALFLAKVIHYDLTAGNASAWHYWNAYEPGSARDPRYYLIALNPRREINRDTLYTVTKNLWALGHYSRFVRPGMMRIETSRNDNLNDTLIARNVMISAFKDARTIVVNLINYSMQERKAVLAIDTKTSSGKMKAISYVTSARAGDDMRPYPINIEPRSNNIQLALPARSIMSVVIER